MRSLLPHSYLSLALTLIGCTSDSEVDTVEFPNLPEIKVVEQRKAPKAVSSRPVTEFVIALVGEVRGELEPCGCPTLPYGGFPRRMTALEELREQNTVFHLDAGETLLKGFFSNKDSTSTERALLIGELSNTSGVDVWTVGPSDLMAVGMDTLQTMPGPIRISATWHSETGERYFEPFVVLSKSNIDIAVIGLSTSPTDPRFQFVQTKSAKETLSEILPTIPTTVDMIVALGSMDDEEIHSIRQDFPEVSLFLTTEGATYEDPLHQPNGSHIIEAPKQGRFIQSIYIRHHIPKEPLQNSIPESDWRTWQMTRNNLTHPVHETFATMGASNNLYFSELIPLSSHYDPKDKDTATAQRLSQFAESKLELSQQIADQPTTPTEPGFAASGRCAQCHTAEMAKWSFSKHARAWESLVNHPVKGSTENPDCIGCHSTGFGQVGGFGEPTVANIRKFKAVQCEACHGPLKGHPNDKSIQTTPITVEACLGCHDEANSPNFDFASYLQQATCQSR